jgi:hypothetical protein
MDKELKNIIETELCIKRSISNLNELKRKAAEKGFVTKVESIQQLIDESFEHLDKIEELRKEKFNI